MARTIPTQTRSGRPPGGARALPVPVLVRVLGYDRPADAGSRHELAGIDEVIVGRGERDAVTRTGRTLTLAIADTRMSQRHARFERIVSGWIVEDLGSRNGTFLAGRKLDRAAIEPGAWLELGRTVLLLAMQEPGEQEDVATGELRPAIGELRTFSAPFARALGELARVATTQQNVVIHGETGTGKELLARAIHSASGREGPFVAVNCGALPETLAGSELFGYRRGAFSGALEDRPGLVRSADGGTLFLDEIADLPLATQAMLLRVLQERQVHALGATRPVAVNVRVVAATHRDLEREYEAGRFREDLLARLAGFVVEVPPLRERLEDLGILVGAILARLGRGVAGLQLSRDAGAALLRHPWPRNVRELEQALGSAAALAVGGVIELHHLPRALRGDPEPAAEDELSPADLRRRDELRRLLEEHRGNIAAVGRAMGVGRQQIHRWLERYDVDIAQFRGKP